MATLEWRRHVNPEDLPTILRARRRQFVFALSFVLLTHLIAASAYLNVVAQLYCCQIADLSRPDPALQSRGRSGRQVIRRTEAVFATDRRLRHRLRAGCRACSPDCCLSRRRRERRTA